MNLLIDEAMPSKSERCINYWADFVELNCFFVKDQLYTIADLKDCANDNDIELKESIADDIFSLLESRSYLYSDAWPYKFENRPQNIRLKNNLTIKQKFYLALLFSSNLKIFNRKFHKFTASFEDISPKLIEKYLPKGAIILNVGSSGISSSEFKNKNLKDRLILVAKKIRISPTDKLLKMEKARKGDFGIDIIAWKDFAEKDETAGTIVVFAQCSCGRNWKDKQLSVHTTSLKRIFNFKDNIISIMTVPHSLRDTRGCWECSLDVMPIILLDRFSFIKELSNRTIFSLFNKYYKSKFSQIENLSIDNF